MKKSLVKKLAIFAVALCLNGWVHAQNVLLNSDFSGWSAITTLPGACQTFSTMCVGTSPTSCPGTGQQWSRIGTPNLNGTSDLFMVGIGDPIQPFTEGIFTNFNFVPGYTYTIHLGVRRYYNEPYNNPGSPIGAIKLYAATGIQQTPSTLLTSNALCQEPLIEDPANAGQVNSFWKTNQNTPYNTLPLTYNVPYPAIESIPDIVPGFNGTGTVLNDYAIQYSPTVFNNQIVIHNKSNNLDGGKCILILGYVKIETDSSKACDPNYTYSVDSRHPGTVTFSPNITGTHLKYNWSFGDGTTFSNGGQELTHDYNDGSYTACLDFQGNGSGLGDGTPQSCAKCQSFCINSRVTKSGLDDCDANFGYSINTAIPDVVNFSASNLSTPSYYLWDFGDGTSSSASTPTISHTYLVPGSYAVTLAYGTTQDNVACQLTMNVCVSGFSGANPNDTMANRMTRKMLSTNDVFQVNTIYPNPTNSDLNIELNMPAAGDVSINIYDEMGRLVQSESRSVVKGKSTERVDIQKLALGVYNIKVGFKDISITKQIGKY